ncbi:MAG: membrane protein insertase YidC, partial [Candidatus Omnitrophica bacterium]|nr:membrane protein insertase YidC [Candidatus Omnitrophota bacterium]
MKEETRIVIAFGLALAVIIFFSMMPNKRQPISGPQQPESTGTIKEVSEGPVGFEISNKIKEFKNQLYNFSVDLLGGKIISFSLNGYTRPGEKNFLFFQNGNTLLDTVDGETSQAVYDIDPESKSGLLILKAKRNGLEHEKIIEMSPSGYSLKVSITQKNISDKNISVGGLNISLGTLILNKHHPEEAFVDFMVINSGKPYKFNIARQMKEKISGNGCVVRTRYQMYYFRSDEPVEFHVENKASRISWGFHIQPVELAAAQSRKFNFSLYMGPSDYFVARSEIKDIRVFGTGFFVSMGRFIFYILNSIHRIIPNWGLAIIILTVLIKLIFFPLTRSSLRSMKQMQKLRPYLQDIQKKYRENSQMLQKEMMNLYKTYKINPFGGCVPMLIQIPIFVGFFLALRSSIYLRGSGFILWIKDLSLPDTVA